MGKYSRSSHGSEVSASSSIYRSSRDSSIGALGRSSKDIQNPNFFITILLKNYLLDRESSLTRMGSMHLRDGSLPRMTQVALFPMTTTVTTANTVRIKSSRNQEEIFSFLYSKDVTNKPVLNCDATGQWIGVRNSKI